MALRFKNNFVSYSRIVERRLGAETVRFSEVVNHSRTVEVTDLLLAQIALERRKRGGLGSRRGGFPTSHISVI